MLCRLSQNSALVPKKWASRKAVSPVMARCPFRMPVMRLGGTSSLRASSVALMPSSRSSSARCSPGCIAVTAIASSQYLVIIYNLYVRRSRSSVQPLKTDPPLLVDADAVLSLPIAGQCFETVAGQDGKVPERRSRFQPVELQARWTLDSRKRFDPLPSGELSRALVPIADDHSLGYRLLCVTSSITVSSDRAWQPKRPALPTSPQARSALSSSISRSNLINSAGKKGFFKNRTCPPFTAGASSTAPEISSTRTRGFSLNTRSANLIPTTSGIKMSEISTSAVSTPANRNASPGRGADNTLTFWGPSMARSSRRICGSSSTIITVRVASNMETLILYPAVRSSTPNLQDFWDNFIGDRSCLACWYF